MATFGSSDEIYNHFQPFMEQLAADPDIGPKFVKANTSFRVCYTDPDSVLALDATQDPPVNYIGDDAKAFDAEIELYMSADDGHKFWLGELNLPIALARRKVKIVGSIPKLMGMLPAITPAYGKYREYTNQSGFNSAS